MEAWIVSNIVTSLLLLAGVGIVVVIRKSRMWSEAAGSLWKRRPIAILVVSFYIAIGILDSIYWVGGMDEVRLSDPLRSPDWIKTSYNNQNDPAAFYSVVDQ